MNLDFVGEPYLKSQIEKNYEWPYSFTKSFFVLLQFM